jgi:hypothetical protein
MKPRYLLFLLAPLLLTACGLSPQQKADYSRVESSGVSPAIYDKMLHGDDLALSDIKSLSRNGVSSAIILRYIRDQGTVYYLSSSDVKGLQKAGVDSSVIDYMLQTGRGGYGYPYGGGYGLYGPYGYGYGYGAYGDPFFYGGPGFYGSGLFIGGGYYGRGYGGYRGGYGGYHGGYGGYHGGGYHH